MAFNTNSRALSFQWILAVLIGTARVGISECSVLAVTQGPSSLNPSDLETGLPYDSGSSSVFLAKILEFVTPVILWKTHFRFPRYLCLAYKSHEYICHHVLCRSSAVECLTAGRKI
jgi:hypothetical protein